MAARLPQSGAINSANNLDQVAIIDLRGPDPGAFHDAYRSWAIRARLEREHGHFDNQVIWMGQVPLIGDPRYATEALAGHGPLARRGGAGRQRDAAAGEDRRQPPGRHPGPLLADPRRRAGRVPARRSASTSRSRRATARRRPSPARASRPTPTSARSGRCAAPTTTRSSFTDDQWTRAPAHVPDRRLRLEPPGAAAAGRDPVADLPGRADGSVIYGGRGLGPAPGGSGWTSPAFD